MIKQKRSRIQGTTPSLLVTDKNGQPKNIHSGKYTRLLGGNVSNNLCWSDHLFHGEKAIAPAIRKRLGALHLLGQQLPQSSRLLLSNGLVISKIYYLIQIWGAAPPTQLKKIQIILNKVAHFVLSGIKRTSARKLMDKCGWLMIGEMVTYMSLVSLWTIIHRRIPRQLADELITDENMFITSVPPRLMTATHGFKHRTIGNWNQLDTEIRMQLTLPKFKKSVKNWLRLHRNEDPD